MFLFVIKKFLIIKAIFLEKNTLLICRLGIYL